MGETYDLSQRRSISMLVFILNILVVFFPFLHVIIFSPKNAKLSDLWKQFQAHAKEKEEAVGQDKEESKNAAAQLGYPQSVHPAAGVYSC